MFGRCPPNGFIILTWRACAPQQRDLDLTLEEMYHGCLKRLVHNRKITDEGGNVRIEPRELTISVKPGMPDGTVFLFEG